MANAAKTGHNAADRSPGAPLPEDFMPLLTDTDAHPMRQLRVWLDEAIATAQPEPTAITLATVGTDGAPSARMLLCKGVADDGIRFYSNYESRKARDIAHDARVALIFFWAQLGRQVRVEGAVTKTTRAESEAYFASRPRGSQIGAWTSAQSSPIPDYKWLEQEYARQEARFAGAAVPCPPHWGGYLLVPSRVEFWHGVAYRLHDRMVYLPDGASGWRRAQLAP